MAIGSENSVANVVRSLSSFMIIFCFAGCAAGSCLSYGHSCWGAHGKRNGGQNNAYLVSPKTMNDMQQGLPSLTKEQLILSRLIGGPLTSDKYKGRWDRLFKMQTSFPEHLDDNELNAHLINNEPIRDQNNNKGMDEGKRMRTNEVEDIIKNINDERKEIPEILILNNENNQHGSKPQSIGLYKFLTDMDGNFE